MNARALLAWIAGGLLLANNGLVRADPIDPAKVEWSVKILIDTSQPLFGENQEAFPNGDGARDNRGLALSPDGRYLYAGYNNAITAGGVNRNGIVRRIDLNVLNADPTDMVSAWDKQLVGKRGKAISVDDAGRVYLAEGSNVTVHSADLSTQLFTIPGFTDTEGVAVTREAGQLVVYSSDRSNGQLEKRVLTEMGGPGGTITAAALDTSFSGDGILPLGGGLSLRGVEVDAAGNVWVAAFTGNTVFRVTPDGATTDSAFLSSPFDIGAHNGQILVTRNLNRDVALFSVSDFEDGSLIGDVDFLLDVPTFLDLELDPNGNEESGDPGSVTGIAVGNNGFYLSNENGQTLDQKSTYGVTDSHSGFIGPDFFQDTLHDDNEPILFALVPEPQAIVLGLLALIGFLGYAWRFQSQQKMVPVEETIERDESDRTD